MSKSPNFLFFITDQHRADWLGCYGHPVVKTPHIDALAGQGTRFENFHVASPICMPNRASLMTGRMPSVHGLRYTGCRLPRSARTFVDVLAAAGYDTASIGKSHLEPFLTEPSWQAKTNQGGGPLNDEAWIRDPSPSREHPSLYENGDDYQFDGPYFGFSHVELCTLHGVNCGGHYRQWLRRTAPNWRDLLDPANELPHNYSCPQAFRTPMPEELYTTSWVADRAIDYLQVQKSNEDPFFAFVSFPDPHHPFNPPGKYWDMYDPDQFDLPIPYAAHKNPTPPLKWLEEDFHKGGASFTQQTASYQPDQALKEAMALSAGMITMIDDHIGRVVNALKDNGQFDNTIICFNSDHGDYMGDFNLLLKGLIPIRGVTRVPFIWSDPQNREANVSQAMASTIDVSATILDRAGLKPYFGMQGQSMLPAVNSDTAPRDEVLVEFNDSAPKFGFKSPARVRSLVTPDWRYTLYAGEEWGELYDLRADPKETFNLWDDPDQATIRAELALRMNHQLAGQMDESPRAEMLA